MAWLKHVMDMYRSYPENMRIFSPKDRLGIKQLPSQRQ